MRKYKNRRWQSTLTILFALVLTVSFVYASTSARPLTFTGEATLTGDKEIREEEITETIEEAKEFEEANAIEEAVEWLYEPEPTDELGEDQEPNNDSNFLQ